MYKRQDAAYKPVGELRLDDVAQRTVPAGKGKVTLERGGTEIDGGFKIGAVEGVVADGGSAAVGACEVGYLACLLYTSRCV